METMDPNDSDEEEGKKKGKKDKHKKNMFKIERGYLVNKIFKLARPYYNIADKDTGLNKFKYLFCLSKIGNFQRRSNHSWQDYEQKCD